MTFKYAVEELGLNLTYSEKPGGFWGPSVTGLMNLIKEHNVQLADVDQFVTSPRVQQFVEENLPPMTYRTVGPKSTAKKHKVKSREDKKDEETGYDSGSDSEVEEMDFTYKKFIKPNFYNF